MALGSRFLRYDVRDAVGWVTIDRPDARNACTLEMYAGIAAACATADADPEIHATVITGVGDVFCPGGDMRGGDRLQESGGDGEWEPGAVRDAGAPADPFSAIEGSRKVVIAAVNGICQGGGFIISMLSDLTIASDRATFRVPELLRGVADAFICTRLPLYVGMERAKWLMFTCETIDARRALEWGLVSDVVDHDRLHERVESVLDLVLRTGPSARSDYKAQANRLLPAPDMDMFMRSLQSPECHEGFAAFSEKRPPAWVPPGRAEPRGAPPGSAG